MPRDVSNVYSPPAGTKGTPNTTIESAKYNAFVDDLAADLNLARPIVAGGTGATSAANARTNLGMGNVDNTSDANKPISTATQTALSDKVSYSADTVTTAQQEQARINIGVPPPATQAVQEDATSTTSYVTPASQQWHPSAAKVWLKCNAAGVLEASYNVTSITDDGVGLVTVTIATDFSSGDYSIIATPFENTTADQLRCIGISARTAGSFQGKCVNHTPTKVDPIAWYFAAFGDQV